MARSTRARRTDPETSHQAAERITLDKLTTTQALVVGMFRMFGPMHDAQLVERVADTQRQMGIKPEFAMSPSAVRSRRSECSKPNMVRLEELMVRWAVEHRPRALGEWNIELVRAELEAHEINAAGSWARTALRSEGFRAPLWDTGERVKVKGSNVIVWGLAV